MRKCLLLSTALLLISGLLLGTGIVGAKEVLTIAGSQNWIRDIDRQLAKEFEEETGIKVDFQVNPDDQYLDILRTKLNTGVGPDIFYWNAGVTLKQLPEHKVMDLTNEEWVPRLKDWARNGAIIEGKLWGLNLWSVDGWGMIYNTEFFNRYDLSPPKDFTEFMEICETLTSNGIIPLYEIPSELWHTSLYLNEIAAYVDYHNPGFYNKLNTNQLKFAEVPEFELTLKQLKDMADSGYLGKKYMSNSWGGDAYKALVSGEYAMFLGYTSWPLEVANHYPESGAESWKMFPSPFGTTGEVDIFGTSAGGIVQCVNQDTDNLDLVRKYFAFRTRNDNLQKFYDSRGDLSNPSFPGVEADPPEALSSIKVLVDNKFHPDAQSGILFFDIMSIGKYIEEMLLGGITPEEALEKIDRDRQKLGKIANIEGF